MPRTTCVIPFCSNPGDHIIPRDKSLRDKWIHAIKRGKTKFVKWSPPSKYSYVCKSHFTEDDYISLSYHGPGLGFMAYPEALSQLPLPNLWAVLFFIMLFTVGLDSQFACVEASCTAITDSYPSLRKKRPLLTAILCIVWFLPGLSMCTEGGMYIFWLLDWYISSLCLPLAGFLECIIFGWIYGAEMFSRDIQLMIGRSVPIYIRILWCFITPALMAAMFIFILATYQPPTYGNYVYPRYAEVLGLMIAFLPLIPLPICAVIVLKNTNAPTLIERFKICLKPTTKWTPVKQEEGIKYPGYDREYRCGIVGRIKMNILGHE